ncbi:M56 family metallopeptidase [Paradesertivirga mongoliensis]|uniref:M56 family metallopeptidase n=1 Tax=Paradesertivirga mongoliensis TaxID=2100740 RepID=A0ABW4ZM06_9SPHI|nr:M56 family metallopeptidase [Pedobacter mongoliensis]
MSIFYYFIEANAYLIIFYAFYKVLLQKETFYSLNRFYLLTGTALSFLLPFIDLSAVRGVIPVQTYTAATALSAESTGVDFWEIAFYFYSTIVFGLLLRLASQIYGISRLVKSGEVIAYGRFKEVQIRAKNLPFSFFHYLFINPEQHDQNTIRKHELVHICQRHSLDILFIELVQITNWFNPVIALLKTDIKAIHEFIADEIVSKDELGAPDYAMFLIQNSYGSNLPHLSNQMFNQSLLKSRIMKLGQKKSGDTARLKYGLLSLLIPCMLGVSAFSISKPYGIFDLMPAETAYQDTVKKTAINTSSPSKISSAKKNPVKVMPKPTIKNVKFPPPRVVKSKPVEGRKVTKAVTGDQIKEVRVDERIKEVRINEPIKEVRIIEVGEPQPKELAPPPPPPVEPDRPKSSVTIRSNRKSVPPPPPPVMNIRLNKDIPPPPPVDPKSKSFKGTPTKEQNKSETIQAAPVQ